MAYIEDALRTASDQYYGNKVSKKLMLQVLNEAIVALQRLDVLKKALFYGKENTIGGPFEIGENCYALQIHNLAEGAHDGLLTFHGIIGAATETGEMLESIMPALFENAKFDNVNLDEETGDVFWYLALIAKGQGFTFTESQAKNIAKLRGRYPDKFTTESAIDRDLKAEREILERPISSFINEPLAAIEARTSLPKPVGPDPMVNVGPNSTLTEITTVKVKIK